MTDKSLQLQASLVLLNDKLHFNGQVENNTPISIDYIPPLGDNLGYTSLELFLLSLSSCIGSAVLLFLRKKGKLIKGLEIQSTGTRKTEHPTGFKTISLQFNLQSPNTSREELDQTIAFSENYCPVWGMIKGNVEIVTHSQISA